MALNFFDLVQEKFFNPLTNTNKQLNYDLLSLINRKMDDDMKQFPRDEVISWIIDYFENHSIQYLNDETNEYEDLNIKDRASEKLRYFVSCGWIVDENDTKTLQPYYQMDSNAILILNTMDGIVKSDSKPIEFTGYVYSIYTQLIGFDFSHATDTVEQLRETTKVLIDKLRGINVSIKKYLNKLIRNKDLTPEEILHELFDEYHEKIILRNFDNLRSKDNPAKYRNEIIKKIDILREEDNLNKMVLDYIDKKKNKVKNEENIKEAKLFFKETLDFVEDKFEDIENNLEILNTKNTKYITTAKSRLMFILNEKEDIEGKLINLLKNIEESGDCIEDDTPFPLFDLGLLDENSLYEPRVKRSKTISYIEDIGEEEIDEEEIERAKERMFKEAQFNVANVNKFIMSELGEYNRMEAKDMKITSFDDVLKIFLACLYSDNSIVEYKINLEKQSNLKIDETFVWKDKRITNYIVEKK